MGSLARLPCHACVLAWSFIRLMAAETRSAVLVDFLQTAFAPAPVPSCLVCISTDDRDRRTRPPSFRQTANDRGSRSRVCSAGRLSIRPPSRVRASVHSSDIRPFNDQSVRKRDCPRPPAPGLLPLFLFLAIHSPFAGGCLIVCAM